MIDKEKRAYKQLKHITKMKDKREQKIEADYYLVGRIMEERECYV